jgi:hypothetical protein
MNVNENNVMKELTIHTVEKSFLKMGNIGIITLVKTTW